MSLKKKAFNSARSMYMGMAMRHPSLRKIRYTRWNRLGKKYDARSAAAKTNPKSIVFECFNGQQFTCSPRAIYEFVINDPRFDDWTLYWSFKEDILPAMQEEPELQRAYLVARGSDAYYQAFATSKYWVQNNRVPEYVTPREDQVYVQCWHGTPLKKLGADVAQTSTGGALNSASELAERFRMDSAKWTYLLSPSAYTSQHLADAFSLPQERRASTVLEYCYPRNDFIRRTLDAEDAETKVNAIKQHLGLPGDKKILLYAPTFRDDQYDPEVGYVLDTVLNFDELLQGIGDEWAVIVRLHYYVANQLDLSRWQGRVFDLSKAPDINQLYVCADCIVTDYSSVFFDYANTGRPVMFYWPDFDHYARELHGLYLDPSELPGPKCTDTKQVVEQINNLGEWETVYGPTYADFRKRFCPNDDGHAAQRVAEKVLLDVEPSSNVKTSKNME